MRTRCKNVTSRIKSILDRNTGRVIFDSRCTRNSSMAELHPDRPWRLQCSPYMDLGEKGPPVQGRDSGVIRDGVTWGGNIRCHPIFPSKKTDDLFSCRLTTPIFPRRLSSVLSKFSHEKNNFRRVTPPWRPKLFTTPFIA